MIFFPEKFVALSCFFLSSKSQNHDPLRPILGTTIQIICNTFGPIFRPPYHVSFGDTGEDPPPSPVWRYKYKLFLTSWRTKIGLKCLVTFDYTPLCHSVTLSRNILHPGVAHYLNVPCLQLFYIYSTDLYSFCEPLIHVFSSSLKIQKT